MCFGAFIVEDKESRQADDEGERWQEIAQHLPTILSVEALDRR
jgi:hypothetical protein